MLERDARALRQFSKDPYSQEGAAAESLAKHMVTFIKLHGDIQVENTRSQSTRRESQIWTGEKLQAEWNRQTERLILLGFHSELGMTDEDYRNTFPNFLLPPDTYKGLFLETPLVVDPRVPLKKQLTLAFTGSYIDTDHITNITDVPDKPYTIWTTSPRWALAYTVEQALFRPGSLIPSPIVEVISLYLQRPQSFRKNGVCAPGSRDVDNKVSCLFLSRSDPKISSVPVDSVQAGSTVGKLFRGAAINIGS